MVFALRKMPFINTYPEIQNIRIPHDNLNWQTIQVIKIYDSCMVGTLPRAVLNAFSIDGIDVYLKNGDSTFTLYAKVDRSQAQKVRHFQNTSPKKLSKKRISTE